MSQNFISFCKVIFFVFLVFIFFPNKNRSSRKEESYLLNSLNEFDYGVLKSFKYDWIYVKELHFCQVNKCFLDEKIKEKEFFWLEKKNLCSYFIEESEQSYSDDKRIDLYKEILNGIIFTKSIQ